MGAFTVLAMVGSFLFEGVIFLMCIRLMFGGYSAMRYRRRNIHYSKEYMHWMKCFLYRASQMTLFIVGNASFGVLANTYLYSLKNGTEWNRANLWYIPLGMVCIPLSMLIYHAMRRRCIKVMGEENGKELHRRISATGFSIFASIYLFPLTIVTEIFRMKAISEESEYETTLIGDIGGSHVGQVRSSRRYSAEESERERRKWDGF